MLHPSSRLCHPSLSPPQMTSFLSVIRVLYFGFLVSTAVANNVTCRKPKVRCEWRKLSRSERTEWINAVNVLTFPSRAVHDADLWPLVPCYSPPRPQADSNCSSKCLADPADKRNQLIL